MYCNYSILLYLDIAFIHSSSAGVHVDILQTSLSDAPNITHPVVVLESAPITTPSLNSIAAMVVYKKNHEYRKTGTEAFLHMPLFDNHKSLNFSID